MTSVLKRKTVDVTADTAESSSSQSSEASAAVQRSRMSGPMNKYVRRENTLQSTIARMTACDGIPFRTFMTSVELRKCLMARGFRNLPTSSETVKQMVMDEGCSVRSLVINELARKKRGGQRFSLTLDEWTTGRNRRYMNINVHEKGGAFWSLGLIRVINANQCVLTIDITACALIYIATRIQTDCLIIRLLRTYVMYCDVDIVITVITILLASFQCFSSSLQLITN